MALAETASPFFLWGSNGRKLTPEEVARERASANALLANGVDYSPVESWTQGLARVAQAGVGAFKNWQASQVEDVGLAGAREKYGPQIAALLAGGAQSVARDPVLAALAEPQTAVGATSDMAGDDFLSGLISSESGGNWNALNNEGYGGRLQFGDARLADAAAAGIIPAGVTGADFSMMSPEMQQAVEQWHFADIDQQAANMGLNQYFGQTIGGVPINADSVRAMAHLGGIGGAQQFITSGGQYNPSDSNGTNLSDYGTRFGGGAPGQSIDAIILEALSDPWAQKAYGPLLNTVIERQMRQSDPLYQMQVQAAQQGLTKGDLEIAALLNPAPELPEAPKTVSMFDPVTGRDQIMQWNAQLGDWQTLGGVAAPDEPLVNLSMGDTMPGLGKLSTDFTYVTDPATGLPVIDPITNLPTAAPVPGSPAAIVAQQSEAAAAASASQTGTTANIVREDIGRIRDIVSNAPWFNPAVGFGSGLLQQLEGTNATNVAALSETVRANIGFDRLQAMREASPTGGALGNVTERELSNLQAVMGNLGQSQSVEQFLYNLDRLGEVYDGILEKAAAYPNAGQFGFGPGGASGQLGSDPMGLF